MANRGGNFSSASVDAFDVASGIGCLILYPFVMFLRFHPSVRVGAVHFDRFSRSVLREGEAPAEPFWIRSSRLRGLTGASPSRVFSQLRCTKESSHRSLGRRTEVN
jgi:hypothetical protein